VKLAFKNIFEDVSTGIPKKLKMFFVVLKQIF